MSARLSSVVWLAFLCALLTAGPTSPAVADPCQGRYRAYGSVQVCSGGDSAGVSAGQSVPGSSGGSGGAGVVGGSAVGGVGGCVPEVLPDGRSLACLTPLPVAPSGGGVDVVGVARSAAASLRVPALDLVVGPDPGGNRWNVLAVGLPVWLWASGVDRVSESVGRDGVEVGLVGTRGEVRVDWGDGTASVCRSMTERWSSVDPLLMSPDCGHRYLRPGDYVISAEASWDVVWEALGQSGTLVLTSGGSYELPIRNFSSVVVG